MRPVAPMLIQGGSCVDPVAGTVTVRDLFVENGCLASCPDVLPPDTRIRVARGQLVLPGCIDLHVHLREPGGEEAETIASGAWAAAHGGFTTVVAMPNTTPPVDTPERVAWVLAAGARAHGARVCTTACLTQDRAGGAVAPLAELAAAGAIAFTDDGCTVQADAVMREAMAAAAALGVPVMDHAQDRELELRGGAMHEGTCSQALGLPGIPAVAETRIVERDIRLAAETSCALHIQHVSCAESVELIQRAQANGVRVTAEATPHHLWFSDEDVRADRADAFKMNPPLRTPPDRARLQAAVLEGILAVLATDHAPHSLAKKQRGFVEAPFGVVGLETALAATYTLLVHSGRWPLLDWVRAWTLHPAKVLGLTPPTLEPGAVADLTLFDPDRSWKVDPDRFQSRSRNTPFAGHVLQGAPVATLVGGEWRFQAA
jgi:dihydroorotase